MEGQVIKWMHSTIQYIQTASAFLGVVIPLCVIAFSAWEYTEARKFESKQNTFENYHLIVERFAGGEKGSVFVIVANIFELRNYPEYREVSLEILKDMKLNWQSTRISLIEKEIDETMKYLKSLDTQEKKDSDCTVLFSWGLGKPAELNAL